MDNGIEKLRDLIDKYWDAAWREGRENRMHDDEAGTAMAVRHEIESILSSIEQGCCGEQSAESETQRGLSSTGEMQSGAQEGGEAVAWHVLHSDGNVDLRPRKPAFLPQDAADAEVIIRPLVFGDTQPSTSMQEDWWVNLIDRAVPDLSPEPDQGQYPVEWALWADHQRIRQEIATAVLCTPQPADSRRKECCCGETDEAWRLCSQHGPNPPAEGAE